MKATTFSVLFAGIAHAHYSIKELTIDGNKYLARDARLDDWVGAKRIEWSFKDNEDFTWMATTNVNAPGFACGENPVAPPLTAKARAGADVTIQWTAVPVHHWGPSMSYLGEWKKGQNPSQVNFFKIEGRGYNSAKGKWANEEIIANGNKNQVKIPSDIKPGTYILRTELLSLHGNGQTFNPGLKGLPQFYIHCFNIEITGSGTATPQGVKFPGGYPKGDAGVGFILGNKARYPTYVVPGPPIYKGQYSAPAGSPPQVTKQETGDIFPASFDARYKALLAKMNAWSDKSVEFFDSGTGGMSFISKHQTEATSLTNECAALRQEAIKLGFADASKKMQNSKIFKRAVSLGNPFARMFNNRV
jgi:cellulase